MDAIVQIKLSPSEFDIVREALRSRADHYKSLDRTAGDPASRAKAREASARAASLLTKLQ